jgi:hypothetical protein
MTAHRPLPASHLDLFAATRAGVLTTVLPDGGPHSCLVRVGLDDGCARVHTTRAGRSGRNLLANPAASLLVVDPADTGRYIQIRGVAELACAGPWMTVRLPATRITTDAIHR